MKSTPKHRRLCALLITTALVAAPGGLLAQTPAPAPAPAPAAAAPASTGNSVSEVTVVGTKAAAAAAKASGNDRVLRLDQTSAASCTFSAGADDYIEGYLSSLGKGGKKSLGSNSNPGSTFDDEGNATGAADDGYFSANSPFGDTANPATSNFFSNFDSAGQTDGCGAGDKLALAGRSAIAQRDKTLPQGYALYDEGKYAEALEMFKAAYKKLPDKDGGLDASLMAGKINLQHLTPKPNVPEAVMWLERAATSKFNANKDMPAFDPVNPYIHITPIGEASMLLAKVYMAGYGVPKNPKAARKWFDRANEVGVVPAAKTLGDIYYYGYDTPQDVKEAVKYYKQAATLGFAPAQYALAEIYYLGELGQPDVKTALAWYNEAAKVNHPGALYALAIAYDSGEGVPADPQKALGFYKAAATNGNVDAQSAMGTYFYQGDLVAKDHVVARKWFELAASRMQPDAMFNLSAMLMKGEGGDKDLVKAWVYMKMAQIKGHSAAAAGLVALEKRMTPEEKQAASAILSPKKAG